MASTYVNDLRLNEMATGDASGTWGTNTNTNLSLIGEALGFGTEGITTNADTHTSTVADGATDPVRAMYVKYTGTLDSACTITIAPNTINRMQFIENGTSGSQNIIISQGSGANITIPPGDTKAVYLDGAGSGAAVVDAFASLSVVDLKVQDDLTVTDDATIGGTLGVTGIVTLTDDLIIGDGKTIGSASDVDAITIAANGQLTLTQTLIGTALDISGDIDVDGTANLDVVDIDGAVDMASTLAVGGAATFSGDVTLASATANKPVLTLTDTNADSQGPDLVFRKDSASPADGDELFRIYGYGDDDAGNATEGFLMLATMTDVSNGSEDTKVRMMTYGAGSQRDTLTLAGESVGIGTTSPARSPLHLATSGSDYCQLHMTNGTSGSASGDGLTLFTNSADAGLMQRENSYLLFGTNDTERMRITATGTLVVGATTSTNTANTFDARDGDGVTAAIVGNNALYVQRGQDTTAGANFILQSNRGSLNSPANSNNGDNCGQILFRAYHTNGHYTSSIIRGIQDGPNGTNDMPGTLQFLTSADGSATPDERMRISLTGGVGIGTTSTSTRSLSIAQLATNAEAVLISSSNSDVTNNSAFIQLQFQGDATPAAGSKFINFANQSALMGSIKAAGASTVQYNTSSDERLKDNIVDADGQLETVLKTKVREFDWKNDGVHNLGFIAQELNELIPDIVYKGGDDENKDPWQIDYGKITPYLVKAIQEQQEQIEQLKTEIEKLH